MHWAEIKKDSFNHVYFSRSSCGQSLKIMKLFKAELVTRGHLDGLTLAFFVVSHFSVVIGQA